MKMLVAYPKVAKFYEDVDYKLLFGFIEWPVTKTTCSFSIDLSLCYEKLF
jgi:hypothetical protein